MTPAEQRMAISHEIAHIRRGDLRWGCVPALAEALFFFHPLAHVCAREYALWREAACDAAVIETTGAAPRTTRNCWSAWGHAGPAPDWRSRAPRSLFSNLKRRLLMLNASLSTSTSSRVRGRRDVGLRRAGDRARAIDGRAEARAQADRDVYDRPRRSGRSLSRLNAAAWQEREQRQREATYDWRLRSAQGQPTFVIFRDDATHLMDGSLVDLKHAEQFRKGKEELIWVRQDGREYISRDATLLRQLRELWAPVSRLGEQQSRIGEAQSEIGERTERAWRSAEPARHRTEQARLAAERDRRAPEPAVAREPAGRAKPSRGATTTNARSCRHRLTS
jgi:hypothetical protein